MGNSDYTPSPSWGSRARIGSALLLMAGDYIALVLASILSVCLRNWLMGGHFVIPSLYQYFIVPAVYMVFIFSNRMYTRTMELTQVLSRLFLSFFWGTCFAIILMYFAHVTTQVSRLYVALFAIFGFGLMVLEKPLLGKFIRHARWLQVPVLIVGAGKSADAAIREMKNTPGMAYHAIGFLEDSSHPESKFLEEIPILGGFADLEKVVGNTGVRDILIAAPGLSQDDLSALIYRAQTVAENVNVIPNLVGVPMSNIEAYSFFDEKIVLLRIKNNLALHTNQLMKRIFDLVVGGIAAILLLPFLGIIAYLIKRDSPGPAFFNAERIGKDNKPFICYKFRSMYMNSDEILEKFLKEHPEEQAEWDEYQKIKGRDPRVTRIGEIIRKYSIDELPQIFNVLQGTMSLVGPRPYLPREREKMGRYLPTVCMTMPGITGLWQVSGRNDISFAGRLHLDEWYVHNWSLWLDIVLIWRTIGVLLNRKGAY